MSSNYDVVVIGAGITGASVAYWLKKKGVKKVLLLEKGAGPACSNTGKSAAIIRTFYTIPLMARLARDSVLLFQQLSQELGSDGGFKQTGFTQLIPPNWVAAATEKVAMHQALGIDTTITDPIEFARQNEWLNPDGVGGVVYETNSGYADPIKTTEAFAEAFAAAGGEARYRSPCRGLIRQGDRITGVETEDGPLSTGAVINAAGPWARYLAEFAGLDMPLRAVREQDTVWEMRPGRPMPTTPVANAVDATYLRPLGGLRWLMGRGFPKPYVDVDANNYKENFDNEAAMEMYELTSTRVPAVEGAKLLEGYAALYDVTPDWLPFVGPRQGLEGYYDLSGGSGHLFKTGPVIARELVDWIVDNTVADDFRQFSHDRIAAGNLFQQGFGGNRV
ncbi:MAG: FAD-binding oxidoreductase [Rhodospirillales bacterium]|nr:FAD-binding oxidoreductase [Rhodospirillales bacterium]